MNVADSLTATTRGTGWCDLSCRPRTTVPLAACSISFRQQTRVDVPGQVAHHFPRMLGMGIVSNFLTSLLQLLEQITVKIFLDCGAQVICVARLTNKACSALDDILPERPNIGRNHRQTKTVCQKKNSALKYLGIGEDGNVCRLEIQLSLFVGDEFDLLDDLLSTRVPLDCLLDLGPVFLASSFTLASNNQPVLRLRVRNRLKCGHQMFKAFVRLDGAEEQDCLFTLADSQQPL